MTYKILRNNDEMGSRTRNIMATAFKHWADASALRFTEVHPSSSADLKIDFVFGDHKDGYPFDNNGSNLNDLNFFSCLI